MTDLAFNAHCGMCGATRKIAAIIDGIWFRVCLVCDAPAKVKTQ